MSIRYECEKCGSVLKIKEELAGKPGKCPKCKTAFTVPSADVDSGSSGELAATDLSDDGGEPVLAASQPTTGDNFDVDAFLMGDDEPATKAKTKSSKGSRVSADVDADHPLDEPEVKAKPAKSRPDKDDFNDTFEIRRGPDAPGKAVSALIPGLEDDEQSDEQPVAARRPPGTNPNAPASNIASDLLSKSSKKGKKANWEDEPEPQKKEEPVFDWDALWYEARTKLLPVMGGGAVICLLVYFLIRPMFADKSYRPPLGIVTGIVTVNGKPLVGAQVWFHPLTRTQESGGKTFKITASYGQTDAAGHYELVYPPEYKGAAIGKCRVEIMTTEFAGIHKKYLSTSYNPEAPIVEIKAGKQVIDLELSQ